MNDPMHQLRPLRPLLVRAAEAVFQPGTGRDDKKLKSQLNHLSAVCNEASCHEEIALYLRYQSAREHAPISGPLAEKIITSVEQVFITATPPITDRDHKLAAWRIYAVYLARAFTYYNKSQSPQRPANRSGDAPRANTQPPRGRQ